MLSVGIPVFNSNVTSLVTSLVKQANDLPEVVEIMVLDDASEIQVLSDVLTNPKVKVVRHPENRGRSKARNTLASEAKSPWILFIDGDSSLLDEGFLERWVSIVKETQSLVVVGGSIYQSDTPDPRFFLRWQVSRCRELKSTAFKTNNVAIHASVFNHVLFNEALVGYGHEDTLFGFELDQKKLPISTVINPVLNDALDTNEAFLQKTAVGIKNLVKAQELASNAKAFAQHVRMLRFYGNMKRYKCLFLLDILLPFVFKMGVNRLKKGRKRGLVYTFDLYKLILLHHVKKGASLG